MIEQRKCPKQDGQDEGMHRIGTEEIMPMIRELQILHPVHLKILGILLQTENADDTGKC